MDKFYRLIIYRCLVLIMLFVTLGGISWAEASPQKLNQVSYEEYEEDGRQWLKLEFALSGRDIEYEIKNRALRPKSLILELKNTVLDKKVKRDMAIISEEAKALSFKEKGKKGLVIDINFSLGLEQQEYRIYTKEALKKEKKPLRLVVEIAKDKPEREQDTKIDGIEGVKGHVVVLDPGHGGSDSGAIGPTGLKEKDITLAIALRLRSILEQEGAIVRISREEDKDVYGPYASDRNELQARVDASRGIPRGEAFISIHCNAFTSPSANGTETYYYQGEVNRNLAQAIQAEMVRATGLRDRGINTARFYVLRYGVMPAALVETAFISNPGEEALLADKAFQDSIAIAIAKGLSNFFSYKN